MKEHFLKDPVAKDDDIVAIHYDEVRRKERSVSTFTTFPQSKRRTRRAFWVMLNGLDAVGTSSNCFKCLPRDAIGRLLFWGRN